ncbi:hypothetical protein [Epilithonimonas tenax]|uniref:hypothetical protein n=1 Tax=Epilithonimonas tenax TaxID=191577 RepID=UPI000420FBF7|nr:hypothetical protein [Epilithonimonas tenax]
MNEDFLNAFIRDATRQQEQKLNAEKRKTFYSEIGRKGGLKKKTANHYSKKISIRFTEKEYENLLKTAVKNKLKTAVLIRQILTEYSAVNYTTIPRQSAPLIPRQSAPLKCII